MNTKCNFKSCLCHLSWHFKTYYWKKKKPYYYKLHVMYESCCHCFSPLFWYETSSLGLPADSALTSAHTSWLLFAVIQCGTLMTDVIHWIYWPDAQTESIICLLLLSACFFSLLLPVLITVYVYRALNTHQREQWQLRGQISACVISTLNQSELIV